MGYYQPQGQYPPPGYPPQQPYYPPPPQYGGCLKFFLYGFSLFIPLAGFILGAVYISKGDPESKSLGRACLIIAVVSTLLACCLGVGLGVVPPILAVLLEGGY